PPLLPPPLAASASRRARLLEPGRAHPDRGEARRQEAPASIRAGRGRRVGARRIGAMKVAVVVPWRPNPSRQAAWDLVRDWWTTHLPDAEIITVDTPHQPFVVAAARNEGVRLAERSGADVVVVADADTIPDPIGLSEAIDAAADGKIHQPYSRFGYLPRAATERAIESRQWPTPKTNLGRVSGGVWVCTPEAWRAVGGMDERFRAWGGEDDAFLAAAQTLRGFVCHTGVGMSLWHTYGHRYLGRQHRLNVALLRRYHRARGADTGSAAGRV